MASDKPIRLYARLDRKMNAMQEVREGDCLALLKVMQADNIDIVVTSPPYNIGIDYDTYRDKREEEEYYEFLRQVAAELFRVMKEGASLFLNVGGTNIDPMLPFRIATIFQEQFVVQNHIVWVKSISVGTTTRGHFKPINSPRFLNNLHEQIFHLTKHGTVAVDRLAIGVPYMDLVNIKRFSGRNTRCRGNTWFIQYDTVQSSEDKHDHPAGFPLELPIMCIKLHGGGKVLDPFCGAGTTLLAAKRLGYPALGLELSPKYAKIAKRRLTHDSPTKR